MTTLQDISACSRFVSSSCPSAIAGTQKTDVTTPARRRNSPPLLFTDTLTWLRQDGLWDRDKKGHLPVAGIGSSTRVHSRCHVAQGQSQVGNAATPLSKRTGPQNHIGWALRMIHVLP